MAVNYGFHPEAGIDKLAVRWTINSQIHTQESTTCWLGF